MALIVDVAKSNVEDAKKNPFACGITLMVIGMSKITEKNVRQAQARINLVNALDQHLHGRPSISFKASHLLSVSANVRDETEAKWSTRITLAFMRDAVSQTIP